MAESETGAAAQPGRVSLLAGVADILQYTRAARESSEGQVILVPVDFSRHSRAALLQACRLADLMSVSVVVLHIMCDPGDMPGYYSRMIKHKRTQRIQEIALEEYELFLAEARHEFPGFRSLESALAIMLLGQPVTRILDTVDVLSPQMVVMGSQGHTGFKRISIGSKAEQVVRLCPVPTTIVKARDEDRH